tara:strand:+ start:318 stop:626 length:309 start_codon:yes stop_codon:yes gene_type:complete
MKITRGRLKEIIKEELLRENCGPGPEQANKFEAILYRNDPEHGPIQVGSLISDLGSPAMANPGAMEAFVQSIQHYQNDPNFEIEIVSGGHILSGENPQDVPM